MTLSIWDRLNGIPFIIISRYNFLGTWGVYEFQDTRMWESQRVNCGGKPLKGSVSPLGKFG